jgi:hypothetical protein
MTPETCPVCNEPAHPVDFHDHRVCARCCPCGLSERLSALAEHAADLLRPDPFPLDQHDKVLALVLELTVLAGDHARMEAGA